MLLKRADFQIDGTMHGHRHLALAIAQYMVAAADAQESKSFCFERLDDLFSVH